MFKVSEDTLPNCVAEFARFTNRFTLVTFDATVWPSNALFMSKCLEVFSQSVSMTTLSMGLVLLPVLHAQTTPAALVKHTRAMTDFFMKSGLDVTQQITVSYDKQSSMANDKRKAYQTAMLVTTASNQDDNPWTACKVFKSGTLGPIPLIKIADMAGYDSDNRPGAAARVEQKGVPAFKQVLKEMFMGMDFRQEDLVLVFDVLPNKHAELCRAITQKVLHESSAAPRLVYFGVLRDHKETVADVENMVYSHWDGLADSPPKQRPQEAKPDPILNLLTWSGQSCGFPSSLLNKFATGTTHHAAMLALKEKVQATFPQNFAGEGSAAGGTTSTTVRAAGRPDFSIEGGKKPVDICRQVRLDALPADSFNFPKLASCDGVKGKPAVFITKSHEVYLGNSTAEELIVEGEVFGFNRGVFEDKLITGDPNAELTLMPWRLSSDLQLVMHNKNLMSLADFVHFICTTHGVAAFDLLDHTITQKQHPPAADGGDPVPVPYRYTLSPAPSGKCNSFRPAELKDSDTVRP
ncbi:unnamed protein product [Durusdinium trenchii]|uniref:Uncharacterized protein n=1 Tax=Durusdinium trenchii TaxID=1381693 RepID=A0ABP0JAT9_9DINO